MVGPQVMTLAIPLGTFLLVLFLAYLRRRPNM
jgi:hypothetical protein